MRQNRPSSRHASVRPTLHALEKRVLLNSALPDVKHLAVHAEVSAAGRAAPSTVSDVEHGPRTRANFFKDHGHDNHKGRGRDFYVETNLVSDIPGMAPNTDPNLQGAWGLSFSTTSPFWVSDQAADFNGSGASSVYKVSDTPIPTSSGPVLTVGVANQGGAPPNAQHDQWPDGPGVHRRTGDHHEPDRLPGRHIQGRLHFRQSRRLDLGVERGCELDDRGDRRRCLFHRAGDREHLGRCRPDLRRRPEQRQHRHLQ